MLSLAGLTEHRSRCSGQWHRFCRLRKTPIIKGLRRCSCPSSPFCQACCGPRPEIARMKLVRRLLVSGSFFVSHPPSLLPTRRALAITVCSCVHGRYGEYFGVQLRFQRGRLAALRRGTSPTATTSSGTHCHSHRDRRRHWNVYGRVLQHHGLLAGVVQFFNAPLFATFILGML